MENITFEELLKKDNTTFGYIEKDEVINGFIDEIARLRMQLTEHDVFIEVIHDLMIDFLRENNEIFLSQLPCNKAVASFMFGIIEATGDFLNNEFFPEKDGE